MTSRKFYKTTYKVEVLSEQPIPEEMDLPDVLREAVDGSYSANFPDGIQVELDGKQAAEALREQASDPMFFNLTDEGEDLEDYGTQH